MRWPGRNGIKRPPVHDTMWVHAWSHTRARARTHTRARARARTYTWVGWGHGCGPSCLERVREIPAAGAGQVAAPREVGHLAYDDVEHGVGVAARAPHVGGLGAEVAPRLRADTVARGRRAWTDTEHRIRVCFRETAGSESRKYAEAERSQARGTYTAELTAHAPLPFQACFLGSGRL